MKMNTSRATKLMNRSPVRLSLLLIPFALVCFALSPQARAACQEGCLTNDNTALGDDALLNNTGFDNTAVGSEALEFNVTGGSNTAVGFDALWLNTGSFNTAVGTAALMFNTTGMFNTATGATALQFNDRGSNNAAYGFDALQINRFGSNNTAVGFYALRKNTLGDNNTCIGNSSLYNCEGNNNTAIGISAGMNIKRGNNNICIGNVGGATESDTIRMGNQTHTNTFISGISGATVPTGVGVIVDDHGHLGTITSSARFKDEIKPMGKASEAILALQPVSFRYKHELDPNGIPQFGLVAEDVEKVHPDLVARDERGKAYTVRYEAVNAMLLNEFLKEHRKVEQQRKDFEAALARQQKQIDALTEGLQKVSAQLELSRTAPRRVVDNH
jgi:endosialidase-like protein